MIDPFFLGVVIRSVVVQSFLRTIRLFAAKYSAAECLQATVMRAHTPSVSKYLSTLLALPRIDLELLASVPLQVRLELKCLVTVFTFTP